MGGRGWLDGEGGGGWVRGGGEEVEACSSILGNYSNNRAPAISVNSAIFRPIDRKTCEKK